MTQNVTIAKNPSGQYARRRVGLTPHPFRAKYLEPGEVVQLTQAQIDYNKNGFDYGWLVFTDEPPNRPLYTGTPIPSVDDPGAAQPDGPKGALPGGPTPPDELEAA